MKTTLGSVAPNTRVTLARSNEDVVVLKQDGDDFNDWTLCYCPQRSKRSENDARHYQFARDIECFPVSNARTSSDPTTGFGV